MLGNDFYFSLIKKYVAVFGTLFNDIYIYRSEPGYPDQEIKVPISYGPRDKTLARVEGDAKLNKPVAITLPRMAFEMTGINYAPERKLITTYQKTKHNSATRSTTAQYNPVPYDIDFELSIMVKNAEDGTKIVEQILPFFTPDFTPTVNLIPEMSVTMDIPVVLQSVRHEDTYEGDFETRRAITWTLGFKMKAYIFGPIKGFGVPGAGGSAGRPIIKFVEVNIRDKDTEDLLETVSVQPGVTANGQPTTDLMATISYSDIEPTDDFGYIVTIT